MIGLDTNILIRFLVRDEPAQTAKALSLVQSLTAEEPGWISLAVIMELAWVLTKTYQVSRLELVRILKVLLSRKEILLEQPEVLHNAVEIYRGSTAGFADSLLSASAEATGCSQIFTFDRDAAKTAGMTLLL